MRRPFRIAAALAIIVAVAGCQQGADGSPPPPFELTADAVGTFCGMNLMEHSGPKGQIILKSRKAPVWFSSARDTIAFTLLPEEDKRIAAIYVSDMAKAPEWNQPGINNWTDARTAHYVVDSAARSGMGTAEAVPFSDRAAAGRFAAANGGRVVGFKDIPSEYVLGSGGDITGLAEQAPSPIFEATGK